MRLSHKLIPSLWGTRVNADSLLMMHPGIHRIKDLIRQFLHTPDTDQDTYRAPAHP